MDKGLTAYCGLCCADCIPSNRLFFKLVDQLEDMLDQMEAGGASEVGLEMGLVSKAGAFLSYGDVRLGQGREAARQFLAQNLELAQEMEQRIRSSAGSTHSAMPDK